MDTTLTIQLPEALRQTIEDAGYTTDKLGQEAVRLLAADLFRRQVLSLGQAVRLSGMSYWDFIPFLGQLGIPYADYDDQEVQHELESVEWLAKKPEK